MRLGGAAPRGGRRLAQAPAASASRRRANSAAPPRTASTATMMAMPRPVLLDPLDFLVVEVVAETGVPAATPLSVSWVWLPSGLR
jgi:hypothetical protein